MNGKFNTHIIGPDVEMPCDDSAEEPFMFGEELVGRDAVQSDRHRVLHQVFVDFRHLQFFLLILYLFN